MMILCLGHPGYFITALLTKSFYQHNVNALTLARTHRECGLQSSKLEGQYTPPGLRPVGAY